MQSFNTAMLFSGRRDSSTGWVPTANLLTNSLIISPFRILDSLSLPAGQIEGHNSEFTRKALVVCVREPEVLCGWEHFSDFYAGFAQFCVKRSPNHFAKDFHQYRAMKIQKHRLSFDWNFEIGRA